MKPYPDRQTAAIFRNFSIGIKGRIIYRRFENMEARLFQRTLNEPCFNSVRTSHSETSFTVNCYEHIGRLNTRTDSDLMTIRSIDPN